VNAEAIHGTRPWKLFGEGPTEAASGAFQEGAAYTARDIRFTTKGDTLYAITLGEPSGSTEITALAANNPHERRRVRRVEMLGVRGPLKFRQGPAALSIDVPARAATRHASVFKISFA
jgi:alpha-L-fucosidase